MGFFNRLFGREPAPAPEAPRFDTVGDTPTEKAMFGEPDAELEAWKAQQAETAQSAADKVAAAEARRSMIHADNAEEAVLVDGDVPESDGNQAANG